MYTLSYMYKYVLLFNIIYNFLIRSNSPEILL